MGTIIKKSMVPRSIKNLGFLLAVLLFTAGGVYAVNAALTFSSTSVASDGALTLTASSGAVTITGTAPSRWDIGNNLLSLQTTGNGPITIGNGAITTGTGLFTVAGIMKLQGSASYLQLNGIAGNPVTVTPGDIWYNTSQKSMRVGTTAGTVGLSGLLYVTTADSGAIVNTITETNFDNVNFTLPANSLTVGKRLKIRAAGLVTKNDGANPNLTLRFKYGTTTLISPAIAMSITSLSNQAWFAEIYATTRSAGSSGSMTVSGISQFPTSQSNVLGNTSATTIDTTTASALQLSAQWGTASANYSIMLQDFSVEVMD